MLEAKDTVRLEPLKNISNVSLEEVNDVIRMQREAQAEISFEAGIEEGIRRVQSSSDPWGGVG